MHQMLQSTIHRLLTILLIAKAAFLYLGVDRRDQFPESYAQTKSHFSRRSKKYRDINIWFVIIINDLPITRFDIIDCFYKRPQRCKPIRGCYNTHKIIGILIYVSSE